MSKMNIIGKSLNTKEAQSREEKAMYGRGRDCRKRCLFPLKLVVGALMPGVSTANTSSLVILPLLMQSRFSRPKVTQLLLTDDILCLYEVSLLSRG